MSSRSSSRSASGSWAIRNDPKLRFGKLLAGLASDQPVPAGGSAAAAAVAMGAALVEKAAQLSVKQWQGASKAWAQAAALRQSAEELVDADAFAYSAFVVARRGARDNRGEAHQELESAQAQTINVPLSVIRKGAETVELACALALFGNPNLRSDALVAGQLAVAGAEAALTTMAANLSDSPRDARLVEGRRLVRSASARLRQPTARGSAGGPGRGRARSASSRRQ